MRMQIYTIALALTALLGACKQKKTEVPSHLLQPEKFAAVLVDIRLAEAQQKISIRNGKTRDNFLDSNYYLIYRLHEVEAEQVDTSFKWYARHPDVLQTVDEIVLEKLNRLE